MVYLPNQLRVHQFVKQDALVEQLRSNAIIRCSAKVLFLDLNPPFIAHASHFLTRNCSVAHYHVIMTLTASTPQRTPGMQDKRI